VLNFKERHWDIRLNCAKKQYKHERKAQAEAQIQWVAHHFHHISFCEG
jgi:hypothetical protein